MALSDFLRELEKFDINPVTFLGNMTCPRTVSSTANTRFILHRRTRRQTCSFRGVLIASKSYKKLKVHLFTPLFWLMMLLLIPRTLDIRNLNPWFKREVTIESVLYPKSREDSSILGYKLIDLNRKTRLIGSHLSTRLSVDHQLIFTFNKESYFQN